MTWIEVGPFVVFWRETSQHPTISFQHIHQRSARSLTRGSPHSAAPTSSTEEHQLTPDASRKQQSSFGRTQRALSKTSLSTLSSPRLLPPSASELSTIGAAINSNCYVLIDHLVHEKQTKRRRIQCEIQIASSCIFILILMHLNLCSPIYLLVCWAPCLT